MLYDYIMKADNLFWDQKYGISVHPGGLISWLFQVGPPAYYYAKGDNVVSLL